MTGPLLAYNPGLLKNDELVAQFVAREAEFDRAIEDIRAGRVGHHVLLVGSRGMGKTTLLRRIEAEILRDPAALGAWLPLRFPEEQYNVRTTADFWVNCLDALADAFDTSHRADDAKAVDAAIAALPEDDDAREADALGLLAKFAAGKHLVLLVDNFDLLTERVDGWKVRGVLSDPARARALTVVAATSGDALFTAEYGKPFLDFFNVVPLDPLSFDDARDVLHKLAEREGAKALIDLLDRDNGRFYGLFTLSGGNPRTLVQLYGVLSRAGAAESDIERDLEQLLDQVTPLYKAKFEELATQAQQVLDAVAIHWAPATAHTLAETLRMDVTQVSAQLTRLRQQGWIEKIDLPDTGRTAFQVAERFFNVWYLVRTSRRMRRKLMLLAECLVAVHGKDGVAEHASKALGDDRSRPELMMALARCVEDVPLSRALNLAAIDKVLADLHADVPLLAAEFDDDPLKDVVARKVELRRRQRDLSDETRALWSSLMGAPIPAAGRDAMLGAIEGGAVPVGWVDAMWSRDRYVATHGVAGDALCSALAAGDMTEPDDRDGAHAVARRSGLDIGRVIAIETFEQRDATRAAELAVGATPGELVAIARRVGERASSVRLIDEAFRRDGVAAAEAWFYSFGDLLVGPFPSAPPPHEGPFSAFVAARLRFESGEYAAASQAFGAIANQMAGLPELITRTWEGIAASHVPDEAHQRTADALLPVVSSVSNLTRAGLDPTALIVYTALLAADSGFVTPRLVKNDATLWAAFMLAMRLDHDRASFAPFDAFLASHVGEWTVGFPAVDAVVSVVRGHPVPVQLAVALAAIPRFAAHGALLLALSGRWDEATAAANTVTIDDELVPRAAQACEFLLERGHAAPLAAFLAATPFGDRLLPYSAAADALAKNDAQVLLAWPAETRAAARAIFDRFPVPPEPEKGPRKLRRR